MTDILKKNLWLRIVLCTVTITAAILCGIAIGKTDTHDKAQETGKVGEFCILPDMEVCVNKKYACGETQTFFTDSYTGYTESMLKSINGFVDCTKDDDEVTINLESKNYCDRHYLLMLVEENVLCVFATGDNADNIMEIHIENALPTDEMMRLENGILFDSLEEINLYIDNIET